MKGYADLHEMSEDDRIDMIGKAVMSKPVSSGEKPMMVAVCVDDDDKKVKRYIQKLKDKFPNIRIVDQFKGPAKGVVTIRVAGPLP